MNLPSTVTHDDSRFERHGGAYGLVPRAVSGYTYEVVDSSTRVMDRRGADIGTLNQTASTVLGLSNGAHTIRDIVDMLIAAFPDQSDSIPTDVVNTLATLHSRRLITLSGAPFPEESGHPEYVQRTYHCNRGDIVPGILEHMGWRAGNADEIAELSVWHRGRHDNRVAKHQAFEKFQTHEVRSKRILWENLVDAGLTRIMPDTWIDADAFHERTERGDGLWFLKLSASTLGRGVHCFTCERELRDKAASLGSEPYVIQKGVEDPVLIRDRKFTVRVYVLVTGDGSVYVHEESLVNIQPVAFDPGSTAREIHIDHSGAEVRSSDEFEVVVEHFDAIRAVARDAFRSVDHVLGFTGDPYRFQIFGLDIIISHSRGPVLIEINDWPNIGARGTDEENQRIRGIKQRVLTDMLQLVLEGESGRFRETEQGD